MNAANRLIISSDLHYGENARGDEAVRSFARAAVARGTSQDVLLLGGDLAVTMDNLRHLLELFRDFPGKRAAIPGNHDIWVSPYVKESSWWRYLKLGEIFAEHGFHSLSDRPLIIGDLGLAGAMGWYDYSFRDDIGIPFEAYCKKTYRDPSNGVVHQWADAQNVRLNMTDEEMTAYELAKLENHLSLLAHLPEVMVLMHHLPTKKLLVHPRVIVPRHWRFLNAFLGSEKFSELIGRFPNIRTVVSGHVHRSATERIGGKVFYTIDCGDDFRESLTITDKQVTRERHLAMP